MRKIAALLFISSLALISCKKKEEAAAPLPASPPPAATTSSAAPAPKPAAPIPNVSLAADAPIPGNGLALWLIGDDAAKSAAADGKVASWTNPLVPNVTASAAEAKNQPLVAANAVNGHATVRFDGVANMLKTNIDISPAAWPDVTVVAVFNSATEAKALRKLYGDDDGGYDRAAGLDDRSGNEKNYIIFGGDSGVVGYFALKANQLYLTTDQYTAADFNGWVDGKPALTKVAAKWAEALPNLYVGGTGTVYNEFWNGDLAEIIVYARVLTDAERARVEDYLAKKYGVTVTR